MCVFLSLGPVLKLGDAPVTLGERYVPLPYVFLDLFPPFSLLIEIWRFSMGVQLVVATLAGLALMGRRPAWGLAAGLGIVIEALVLTPGPAVWSVDEPPDEPMAELFEGAEPGAVLHFPVRQWKWPMYYQTLHGQPVANSNERTGDPTALAVVSRDGWTTAELVASSQRTGYRWLVVHGSEGMEDIQPVSVIVADLAAAGLVTRQRGSLTLVDLDQDGPWPSRGHRAPDPVEDQAGPRKPLGELLSPGG